MGLDMYLYANYGMPRYPHDPEATKIADAVIDTITKANRVHFDALQEQSSMVKVQLTAAYWRKANAVHRWFVDNVQGGTDDCGTYWVPDEQLETLFGICDRLTKELRTEPGTIHTATEYSQAGVRAITREGMVIANPELADELLPTGGGFFFGSTAYNEGYLEDVRYTRDRLRTILDIANAARGRKVWLDFQYHSSW